MEFRGNRKYFNWEGRNIWADSVTSRLHFRPDWQHNGLARVLTTRTSEPDKGFDRDFRIYGVEWTDGTVSVA